jgi:uroporphyrinogen III methyltransferase/synthase
VVVRLKGGDPFIFGRGGEEAQVLHAAGIPFEIVPGITAAISVPAYAGIPLSHRDYTASMAFVTGHEREDRDSPTKIAWDKLATGVGTLVFFMGVKNLPEICSNLIANGRTPDTPVACIRWGTTPIQQTVIGTLADIVEKVRESGLKPPAITVVGEVVHLREQLNWFETRPLFGKTIVVTRAREQASDFSSLLTTLGAACVEFPTIGIEPPPSWKELDGAIQDLSSYDWAVFTSVNGVRFFMQRLWAAGKDTRELKGVKVAAIGPSTAEALERFGLRPDLIPGEYRAESILEGLQGGNVSGQRFLIPRAMVAREILPDVLRERGAIVDVVPAYQTVLPTSKSGEMTERFRRKEVHCLTFTSSSTVSNFFSLFEKDEILPLLDGVIIASIGPITSKTVEEHGLKVDIMPSDYTIPALAEAICSHFAKR